jgi:hypothetical protein
MNRLLQTILLLLAVFSASAQTLQKQQTQLIEGTVFDKSGRVAMPGVTVLSVSGIGAITDSTGRYLIHLPLTDSIYFSYQGKTTQKIAVSHIRVGQDFDMSLYIEVKELPTVVVNQHIASYYQDSVNNRIKYKEVFNYDPSYLGNGHGGIGLDLDNIFNNKALVRMENFKAQLEEDERQKYISHRFNRELVARLTALSSPAIDTFMVQYRPTYDMLKDFENDYKYYEYIRDSGRFFAERWKIEHPDAIKEEVKE